MERYKTEEMKRILSDIRDRLSGQLPPHGQAMDSPPLSAVNSSAWGSAPGLQPGFPQGPGHAARGAGLSSGLAPVGEGMLPTPFQSSQNAALLGMQLSAGRHSPQHIKMWVSAGP